MNLFLISFFEYCLLRCKEKKKKRKDEVKEIK